MQELAALSQQEFSERLARATAHALAAPALLVLFRHYEELRRWAPKVDLIGPGAVGELFERHYAEALEALPHLPTGPFRLLDIGSGAGFPGFVLAAARPDAEVLLVEPRARRAAFLAAAARKSGLAVRCLNVRVDTASIPTLPKEIAVVTMRALKLEPAAFVALASRLSPAAALLIWGGSRTQAPPLPFELVGESPLFGSRSSTLRRFRLGHRTP